jgi:hypothetical protein
VLVGTNNHAATLRDRELAIRDDARALAISVSPDIWLEKIQVRLSEPAVPASGELPSDFMALIQEAVSSDELAEALREDLAAFVSSSRASLGDASEDDELRSAVERDDWARVLGAAVSTLRPRLSGDT